VVVFSGAQSRATIHVICAALDDHALSVPRLSLCEFVSDPAPQYTHSALGIDSCALLRCEHARDRNTF
jgi:hypothetical protein